MTAGSVVAPVGAVGNGPARTGHGPIHHHNLADGRVEISTAMTAGRASNSVRNTGPVMPPDEVERLFRPFQKLGPERISQIGGYGLGRCG